MLALQDILGTRDDNLFKAASGLHGGIARMGDVCGAFLSASMVLGAKLGLSYKEFDKPGKKKDPATPPVGKLYKWFEKEFGSVKCSEIRKRFAGGIHYDWHVPWQSKLYQEATAGKCTDMAGKVAARTVEMLWNDIKSNK